MTGRKLRCLLGDREVHGRGVYDSPLVVITSNDSVDITQQLIINMSYARGPLKKKIKTLDIVKTCLKTDKTTKEIKKVQNTLNTR